MQVLFAFIILFFSCIPIFSDGIYSDEILELIHVLIAACCSIFLAIYPNNSFSLQKVTNIYFLFFFCIAPIIQYKNGISFLSTFFSAVNYITTSLYVLFVVISYNLLYIIFFRNIIVRKRKIRIYSRLSVKYELLFVFISVCIFFQQLYINGFSISSLLFRGGDFVQRVYTSSSQPLMLIIENFFRPMSMILFLSSCVVGVKHRITIFILGFLMLFSIPPTGVSRYFAAAIYLPLLLWFIPSLRKKNVFVFLLSMLLLVVFPFFNIFRNFSSESSIMFTLNYDQFKELDFDSYSMFMRVIKDNIVTYGNQLLGVVLFWVPRSLWPTKPIGSGAFVAEEMDLSFSNISMPFFGEGYINAGIFGVILFTIALAYVTAKLDKQFWHITMRRNVADLSVINYFLTLSLLIFILRGDLLSSVAYTCGFLASFAFVQKMIPYK